MEAIRKMKAVRRLFAAALGLLIGLCVCVSCGGAASDAPSTDPETGRAIGEVAAFLEEQGHLVTSYGEGSAMLEALDAEMDDALDEPTEYPLAGYLFAKNAVTGELECEVFVFRTASDARKLFLLLDGGEQFVEGVSEIRQSGATVYMGLTDVLDEIERSL